MGGWYFCDRLLPDLRSAGRYKYGFLFRSRLSDFLGLRQMCAREHIIAAEIARHSYVDKKGSPELFFSSMETTFPDCSVTWLPS